jgi:hypothetical protein
LLHTTEGRHSIRLEWHFLSNRKKYVGGAEGRDQPPTLVARVATERNWQGRTKEAHRVGCGLVGAANRSIG